MAWCARLTRLRVFPEGDITDVMVHFYGPVAAQVREQVTGAGLARGQAGDAEDGDGAEEAAVRAVAVALDQEHLPDVREQFGDALGGRHGLDGADVDAVVAAVCGPVLDGERFPAQRVGRVEQVRLVLPDREHELRAPAHDLPGVLTLGVHLVRADDRVLQVPVRDLSQQLAADRDLVRLDVHGQLGGGGAVVPDPRQQHRRPAAAGGGAAHRLPVDPQVPAQARAQRAGPGSGPRAQRVIILALVNSGEDPAERGRVRAAARPAASRGAPSRRRTSSGADAIHSPAASSSSSPAIPATSGDASR